MMNKIYPFKALWCILALLPTLLSGCMSLADSNPLGLGTSWQEEILLHDGRTMVVDRSVVRGGGHEIGQKPPFKEQRLSFTMPGTKQKVTWEDHFSQDLGSSSFLPMLLDVHNNTAYLVVKPAGCLSYNKWGRPNPPYVIFKYVNNQWQRISLQELLAEIKTVNMISSMPDIVVERAGTSFMTKEMIQKIVSEYRQPEHQTIQREPLAEKSKCGEMIRVIDGWVGIEGFSSQGSHEQCLRKCKIENMDEKQCPCDRLFKNSNKEK